MPPYSFYLDNANFYSHYELWSLNLLQYRHHWYISSSYHSWIFLVQILFPCLIVHVRNFITTYQTASIMITRKPSGHKGKRATAVRVWRPLVKKSTANFQLMVNSNRGRITIRFANCDIFGCRGWKSPFSATILWLYTVAVLRWGQGGTPPPNLAQAPQIFGHSSSAIGWINWFYSNFT